MRHVVVASAVLLACGTELPPAEEMRPGPDAGSADAEAAEPPEPRLDRLACGDTTCLAGQQACCLYPGGGNACSGRGAPCPSSDASVNLDGGAPPAPLTCTSYRTCGEDEHCCFGADGGAACSEFCPGASNSRLCTLGEDGCGESWTCNAFAGSPEPNRIGRCEPDDD